MFTNWLTSPSSSLITASPNLMTTPPDVILEVGPPSHSSRFMAHSVLLAMHSGYLRSALRLDENGVPNPELPIYLTNVTPEQFAPLLTYMYTGYLDLNIENIFGVLLATHVLHMPRPLEICRTFLSRTQSEGYLASGFLAQLTETATSNASNKLTASSPVKVIRPIASKPVISSIGFIVPPMTHISLPSTDTPFRSLHNPPNYEINSTPPTTTTSPKHHPVNEAENHTSGPSSSASPVPGNSKLPVVPSAKENPCSKRSAKTKTLITAEKPKKLSESDRAIVIVRKEVECENKTIVDIASCDGPVRFQRVLNDAYGQHLPVDSSVVTGPQRTYKSVSISFHQQMAKNIRQQQCNESAENSDTKSSSKQHSTTTTTSSSSSGEVFNCVYCKHTFKSQYCYQKHARRHLNPLSLDIVQSDVSDKTNKIAANPKDVKREVRPLDMNVQYYPCKTCGSKFPSYYFVHKHRKMCHANEESNQ